MMVSNEKKSISKSVRLTVSACKEIELAHGDNFSEQLLNLIYSYINEKKDLELEKKMLQNEINSLNKDILRKRKVLTQIRKIDGWMSQIMDELE